MEEKLKTSSTVKKCTPICKYFKCSQRALTFKKDKTGRTIALCNFVPGGDLCQGAKCNYGFCQIRKLKQDLTCGLYHKPIKRSKEKIVEEDEWDKVPASLKSKLMKKIKSKKNFR